VLRIVQEALTNVRRHADATVVRVATEGQSDAAVVSIADNGRGFDPDDVPADRFGLKGMRERAELIGAALAIDARPADGTRVTLRIPKAETAR
jgi:signal transduction histidine kinase